MGSRWLRAMLPLALLGPPTLSPAGEMALAMDIPRLNVAEYHRPYVAIWIAREDHSVAANLAVLYDLELADQEGEKWLKDMRQWWRRSGRRLDMPVDGLSGATRPPGTHTLRFDDKVSDLEPGPYRLLVEAAREVGGREMLEIDFQWPPRTEQQLTAQGEAELGKLILTLKP